MKNPMRLPGAVALLAIAALTAAVSGRGPVTASAASEPWWVMRFPPRSLAVEEPLPPSFEPARVLEGVVCGNLDNATVPPEGGVLLSGWAFDPRRSVPARSVLIVDGERPLRRLVHVYRERPDIASHKNDRALLPTGWTLWIPADQIPPGAHIFRAFAVFDDGRLGLLGRKELTIPAPAR